MKDLNYGKGYKYAHSHDGNFVDFEFLPEDIKGSKFWEPSDNASEARIRERMKGLWKEKYGY